MLMSTIDRASVDGRRSSCQSEVASSAGEVEVTDTSGTGERSLGAPAVMDSCRAALVAFVLLMRAEMRLEWSSVASALLKGEIWWSPSSVLA